MTPSVGLRRGISVRNEADHTILRSIFSLEHVTKWKLLRRAIYGLLRRRPSPRNPRWSAATSPVSGLVLLGGDHISLGSRRLHFVTGSKGLCARKVGAVKADTTPSCGSPFCSSRRRVDLKSVFSRTLASATVAAQPTLDGRMNLGKSHVGNRRFTRRMIHQSYIA